MATSDGQRAAYLESTLNVVQDRFAQSHRKNRRYGISDLTCRLFAISPENERIRKSLYASAFANGDATVFHRVREPPTRETVESSCKRYRRFVPSQSPVDIFVPMAGIFPVALQCQVVGKMFATSTWRNLLDPIKIGLAEAAFPVMIGEFRMAASVFRRAG